jgi:CheY-like chemotaxis protein
VRVESTLGRGSKFTVEIPVQYLHDKAIQLKASSPPKLLRLSRDQKNFRILIVEDHAENRMLLTQLLEQAGFIVHAAQNGAEGILEFTRFEPHFIWMDWRMPVMGGLEAVKAIRASKGGFDVKIAVLSASVFKDDRNQVLAAGADDFVSKPIEFETIFGSMERLLGARFEEVGSLACAVNENLISLEDAALTLLSPTLRAELKNALISLDAETIAAVVHRVAEVDPTLARSLEVRTNRYQYSDIVRRLEQEKE